MWDLIVSVPDHCLSFYFINLIRFPTMTLSGYGSKKTIFLCLMTYMLLLYVFHH